MSEETGKLARNSHLSLLAQVAANASTLLMNICLIRAYGQETHNEIIFLFSIVSVISLVSDLGLASKSGVREIARRRFSGESISTYINSALSVLIILAVIFSFGLAGFSSMLSDSTGFSLACILIMAFWAFSATLQRAFGMVAIGLEKFQYPLYYTIASQGLLFIWSAICLLGELNIEFLFYGWAGVWLFSSLIGLNLTKSLLKKEGIKLFSEESPQGEIKRTIIQSIPFFIPAVCSAGLPALVFLIVSFKSTDNLSLLQVSFSLALVGRIVSQSVSTALFPVITRLSNSGEGDQAQQLYLLSSRFLFAVIFLIVAFTWVMGDFVLVKLYGEEYKEGFYALIIFTTAIAVESYRTQVDQVLMSLHREKSVAFWETAKLLVITAVIFILINQLPLLSAPIAVLIASVVTTLGRILANKSTETFFAGSTAFSAGLGLVALIAACYYLGEYYIVLPTAIVLIIGLRIILVSDLKVLLKMGPGK